MNRKLISLLRENIREAKIYTEDMEPWHDTMKYLVKKETENLSKKKKLFTDIDNWAKEFSKKQEFKEALKLEKSNNIPIFHYRWGHIFIKEKLGNGACWSVLCLRKNGTLKYNFFYTPGSWIIGAGMELNESNLPKFTLCYLRQVKMRKGEWNWAGRHTKPSQPNSNK